VDPYASFGGVLDEVNTAINRYLNPLGQTVMARQQATGQVASANAGGQATAAATGSQVTATPRSGQTAAGAGSDFGQDLYLTNLLNVILGVDHVRAVTDLALTVDGVPYDDLKKPVVIKDRDGMVYGVSHHDIVVEPYVDQ